MLCSVFSQPSTLPTNRALTSPNSRTSLSCSPVKLAKKGTDTYPAITMAISAIIHSLQFFDINPI